jgi:galactokinase
MTAASPAAAVARQALELFGTPACFARDASPSGVWAAPGRVNIIGEHTDYNDGFAAPMAIDRYTAVAAAPRSDGLLRLASAADAFLGHVAEVPLDALAPPAARDWTSYPAGVAWALLEAGVLDRGSFGGADLAIASTVPVGAGLSSSAALECATGLALTGLCFPRGDDPPGDPPAGGDSLSPHTPLAPEVLARLAQRAENSYVGVPCGPLDQLAAAFGVAGAVLFTDTRTRAVTPYPFDLAAAGLTVLVIDTKVHHDLGASGYPDRRAACERAARKLGVPALRDLTKQGLRRAERELDEQTARRVRHVVTENERVLEFARLLSPGAPFPSHGASPAPQSSRPRDPLPPAPQPPRPLRPPQPPPPPQPPQPPRPAAQHPSPPPWAGTAGKLLTASHVSLRDDFEVSCAELDAVVEAALHAGAYGARMTGGGFGGSAIALTSLASVAEVSEAVRAALPQADIFPAVPSRGAHQVC